MREAKAALLISPIPGGVIVEALPLPPQPIIRDGSVWIYDHEKDAWVKLRKATSKELKLKPEKL